MKRVVTTLITLSLAAGAGAAGARSPAPADPADQRACLAAAQYSDARRGLSVLVLHDGAVVCEHYAAGDAETGHELYSGTKSLVGLMAAAAVQDGLLTLDESVSDTLPEWRDDPLKAQASVRQLLSMTAGLPSRVGQPPAYAAAVTMPFNAAPGARFQYGPAPMQVFGELLSRKLAARGEPADPLAYLDRRLLQPLGIGYAAWRKGPDGRPLLPQGAAMSAREWAKVGEFVRSGGRKDENPLVDPEAFGELFQGTEANPGYGLTWWLPRPGPDLGPAAGSDIGPRAAELPADLVMAAGAGDQRLYVIPSAGLVIVRQARLDLAALQRPRTADDWSDTTFLRLLIDR